MSSAGPRWLRGLLLWVGALAGGIAGQATAQQLRHIEPTLVAQTVVPEPGKATRIAIRMVPEPGWHGYWSNPGDSGLSVAVDWALPDGVTVGALSHPAPTVLELAGLASYVHEGPFTLLAELRVDRTVATGTSLPVRANLSWLACSDRLCVPERATLDLTLKAGDGAAEIADAKLFEVAQKALPASGHAQLSIARIGEAWRFSINNADGVKASSAHLFPANDGWFSAASRQIIETTARGWQVTVAAQGDMPTQPFHGVFTDGTHSFALAADGLPTSIRAATAGAPSPPAHSSAATIPPVAAELLESPKAQITRSEDTGALRIALVGAILGGLLLNLMPCVFPILSLKALSLAKYGSSKRQARLEGVAYVLGSVATTTALGGILVAARALGHDIGWSFQLQDPTIILLLMLLCLAIAFNLAGLFELRGPSLSGRWMSRPGGLGSFGTGALAAIIATPCSGPFMGVALGAALVLPVPPALGVFAGLGFGMALPFLLIAFMPKIQEWLPKPGVWMETFRNILAVPMLLTAIGLAWILGRQSGVDGLSIGLLLAALTGLGLWWIGQRQTHGSPTGIALAPVAAALIIAMTITLPSPGKVAALESTGIEPFSEKRLAQLQAAGTPVFVDFTADWCLICQVNKRVAIDRAATRTAFADAGVVTLVGDWTRGDPQITRFLEARGRNSIPYYLFAPAKGAVKELPQVLSSAALIAEANLSRREIQ